MPRHHLKKIIISVSILIVISVFCTITWLPISLTIMGVYSHLHEQDSLMQQEGINLHIPGGLSTAEHDWYPFVMVYHAGNDFGHSIGNEDITLTILYNFPAFSLSHGCSELFNPDSPYYNSFYGAYLVQNTSDQPYSFSYDTDEARINLQSMSEIPRYDLQQLVLKDFGLPSDKMIFEWDLEDTKEGVYYLGYADWTQIDATMQVNGAYHEPAEFVRSYLQYGEPNISDGHSEFSIITMYGRIYARYFPEWNTSIFFYILASNQQILEECDQKILSNSTLAPAS